MAAPQQPGQPSGLPLVDFAFGTGPAAPTPVDSAFGAPQPAASTPTAPADPGDPRTQLAGVEPSPFVTRGGEAYLRDQRGDVFTVPQELAARYVHEQGLIPATPDEVNRRLAEKEEEGFVGGAKAVGAALVEGLYSGIAALPRGVAALGYAATGSEVLKDFVRETAPENLFPTISGTGALISSDAEGLRAIHEYDDERLATEQARAAQRREWATLSTVAESAGLIAGSLATAVAGGAAVGGGARALGVGSQALQGATAAELAFGGGVLRQAAIAGAEGSLQSAAEKFDDGGTPTQREVLQAALFGGLLSAGVAGAATAATNRLLRGAIGSAVDEPATRAAAETAERAAPGAKAAQETTEKAAQEAPEETLEELQEKVFGKSDSERAAEAADDIARQIVPDAPPGVGREALEAKQFYDELDEARRAKIKAAGPNTKAMREAAEEATAEMNAKLEAAKRSAGTITEDNWRGIKPAFRPLLREEIIEAASRDLERSNNALMKATDVIESFLDEAPQKVEKIRANFLADKIDDAKAMREAYATLEELKRTFGETLMQRAREVPLKRTAGQAARGIRPLEPDPQFWKSHASAIASIETTLKKADDAFGQAKDAAEAYIVMDQVRREIAARVSGLAKAVRSDDPRVFDPARLLQAWAKEEYLGRLVPHLGDVTVYGKQGAAQSTVNLARRDVIASGYLGDLTTVLQKDYGEAVRITDPAQTRALLSEIDQGKRSLKQQQLLKNYTALEDMARAVKDGYELTPKQAKAIDEMIQYARSGREIMQTMDAQSSAVRERVIRALMSSATGTAAGIVAGGIAGGPIGSLIGAAVLPVIQNAAKDIVRRVALATAKGAERGVRKGLAEAAKQAGKETAEEVAEEAIEDVAAPGVRAARKPLSQRALRGLSAATLGLSVGASGLAFEPTRGKPRDERLRIFDARRQTLAELVGNPAKMQRAFERTTGDMAAKRPVTTGVLALEMTGKVKKLQEAFPGKVEMTPIAARRKVTPTDRELKKSEALWEAATDPTSVFEDWERGTVDYDKVRFSQELYPGIWDLYRAAVVDALGTLPEDATLSSSQLTQLDFLFGFNGALSPSVNPDFSKRVDQYSVEIKEAQGQPSGGSLNLPTASVTFTQRIASGGRSG